MEKNQILAEVQEIFREVLDNEEIVSANETTADDIEEWDSLNHIQLIVAIEKHFNVICFFKFNCLFCTFNSNFQVIFSLLAFN